MVPVYNTELYLRECLESIRHQTFEQYEVIVVDDGSTDASARICDKYADADSRIQVIHQENKGLFEARRSALRKARGVYGVFVDSDDVLRCDALEILYQELVHTRKDFIAFRCCNNPEFSSDWASSYFSIEPEIGASDSLLAYRRGLLTSDRVNHIILKVISLDLLQILLRQSEIRLLCYEDKYEMAFIYDEASSCSAIDDVLYYYRPNQLSITRRGYSQDDYRDLRFVSSLLYAYCGKWAVCSEGEFYALRLAQIYTEINKIYSSSENVASKVSRSTPIRTDTFFIEAVEKAQLSLLPIWRRLSIRLFRQGHNHLLSYTSVLIRNIASIRRVLIQRTGIR